MPPEFRPESVFAGWLDYDQGHPEEPDLSLYAFYLGAGVVVIKLFAMLKSELTRPQRDAAWRDLWKTFAPTEASPCAAVEAEWQRRRETLLRSNRVEKGSAREDLMHQAYGAGGGHAVACVRSILSRPDSISGLNRLYDEIAATLEAGVRGRRPQRQPRRRRR